MKNTAVIRVASESRCPMLALGVMWLAFMPGSVMSQTESFQLLEATVAHIHSAYESGTLTARELVQFYLDRIDAYDQRGPSINAIITLNPDALEISQFHQMLISNILISSN